MPDSTSTQHDHHDHATSGTPVTPEGSGASCCRHGHSDATADGQHVHASTSAKPSMQGDESQREYTCPMHPQVRRMGTGA